MRIKAEGAGLGTVIGYTLAGILAGCISGQHWPDQTVGDLMSFLSGAALMFVFVCVDRIVLAYSCVEG